MPNGFLMAQGIRPNILYTLELGTAVEDGVLTGHSKQLATTLETQDQNFLNWYLQLQGGGKEALAYQVSHASLLSTSTPG